MDSGLLVLGPSGSGKSTLIAGLREFCRTINDIGFPRRYVTRPPRRDDDPTENISVSLSLFEEMWEKSKIGLRWRKSSSHGLEEYGFEVRAELTVVLGGNDALVTHRGSIRFTAYDPAKLQLVYVWADPETRRGRLLTRNPEFAEDAR